MCVPEIWYTTDPDDLAEENVTVIAHQESLLDAHVDKEV